MRFSILILLSFLAGCQFSINRNTEISPENRVRSGTHAFENGSVRVFGKSWGEYGKSRARLAAYQRLYRMASRTGHTHFHIESENKRHIQSGRWSLLPLATKTDDYHSIRLRARLYKGSKGTPGRALRIEWLRQQFESGETSNKPRGESLRDTLIKIGKRNKPVAKPPKVAAKPAKKSKVENPKPVPTEKPLVIKAPES